MPDTLTPAEIKQAREKLGLTQSQFAAMLDTDDSTIRRMEMAADKKSHRDPAPRMVRLIRAYLAEYRPPDWPARR